MEEVAVIPVQVQAEMIEKQVWDLVALLGEVRAQCPQREISLAITKLEEAGLWLGRWLEQ